MSVETVYVVDDDSEMRSALERLLRVHDFSVRTYASAGDFLVAISGKEFGCIVLDLQMPGPSGLDLQQKLERDGIRLPIVFLSAHGNVPSTVRAIKGGAFDFLTKPVDPDVLVTTVRAALAKGRAERESLGKLAELRKRFESLSTREREVFVLVVAGRLNKQVSGELGIAERTVKMHRANVMEKMNVTSVAELARIGELLKPAGPLDDSPQT